MNCEGAVAARRGDRHRADAPRHCRCARDTARRRARARRRGRRREEIEKVALAPRLAEEEFRRAGRGRVVAERHADSGHDAADFLADRELAPAVHRAGRRADLGRPAPELERRATPSPAMRAACAGVERASQRRQGARDEIQHDSGVGIGESRCGAAADRAAEIDQHEIADCAGRSSARARRRPRDRARPAPSAGRRGRATAPRGAAALRPAAGS